MIKKKAISCVKFSKNFRSKEKGNNGRGSYNKVHYAYEYNYETNHNFQDAFNESNDTACE